MPCSLIYIISFYYPIFFYVTSPSSFFYINNLGSSVEWDKEGKEDDKRMREVVKSVSMCVHCVLSVWVITCLVSCDNNTTSTTTIINNNNNNNHRKNTSSADEEEENFSFRWLSSLNNFFSLALLLLFLFFFFFINAFFSYFTVIAMVMINLLYNNTAQIYFFTQIHTHTPFDSKEQETVETVFLLRNSVSKFIMYECIGGSFFVLLVLYFICCLWANWKFEHKKGALNRGPKDEMSFKE